MPLKRWRDRDATATPGGRGGAVVAAVVTTTLAVGVIAFLVGQGVSTPAEQAARARPPAPSLLTAPVRLTNVLATVVLRGTLQDPATPLYAPSDLGGDLPVVTAATVQRGQQVGDGALVAAVAGRPVFVMQGAIPAYSSMSVGSTGVEVSELQAGLERLGLSTAPDAPGSYGVGTADAVLSLYKRYGYTPVAAAHTVTVGSGRGRREKTVQYASVPRGEIDFVPVLPVEVVSAPVAGRTLGASTPLARLGSGRPYFTVRTNVNTASVLPVGASGTAVSNLSRGSFAIRLAAKRPAKGGLGPGVILTFTPRSESAAAPYVGQNMAIRVRTGHRGRRQWVVPVSAVVTNAAGESTVTVLDGSKQVPVTVRPGLAYGGGEVVVPIHGRLAVGEQVIVGVQGGAGA